MKKKEKTGKHSLLSCSMVLLLMGFAGCGQASEPVQETVIREIEVSNGNPMEKEQYSQVVYGDVVKQDLYNGTITPYVEELFFVQDGVFLEYCVSLGDVVEEGQVLAKTDTESLEATIEQLQNQIKSLTDNYEYRMATIQNNLAILEEEMAINYEALDAMEYMAPGYTATCEALGRQDKNKKSYELEIKQITEVYELELPYYQNKLKEAKKQLNSNVIKAPFAGVVVELRPISEGDRVSEEQPYVAVADTNRYLAQGMYVGTSVVSKAERIYVYVGGKEYEAEYIPLDPKVYGEMIAKRNVAYSAYEISDSEGLSFGQSVVIVVQKESRQNVLIVPALAVNKEGRGYYCYVKRGDEKEKVYIEVGMYDSVNYEVLGGLAEGDEVIIE